MKKWVAFLVVLIVGVLAYTYREELAIRMKGRVALIDEEPYALRLFDLDRRLHSLEDYRGKVVVLDIWATWCTDCEALLGKIEKLRRKYRLRVVVMTLNVDSLTEGRVPLDQVA